MEHKMTLLLFFAGVWTVSTVSGLVSVGNDYLLPYSVAANFEMSGIKGDISITQEGLYTPATIRVALQGLARDSGIDRYNWAIHEYPVRYSLYRDFPCSVEELGRVYDPENLINVNCTTNISQCALGDLGRRLGLLRGNQAEQLFRYEGLQLRGPYSPIGRSIVISREGLRVPVACANIERQGVRVHTFRATFQNPSRLQGEVIFRYVEGRSEVTIYADLYRLDGEPSAVHTWTLRRGLDPKVCGSLYQVYGKTANPAFNAYMASCSKSNPRSCVIGNLTAKCGDLRLEGGSPAGGRLRSFCTDAQLGLIPLSSLEPLTLTIENGSAPFINNDSVPVIVDCAPLERVSPQAAVALQQLTVSTRVFANLLFFQADPYERTYIRSYVSSQRILKSFEILSNCTDKRPWAKRNQIYSSNPSFTVTGGTDAVVTGDLAAIGDLLYKVRVSGLSLYRTTDKTLWLPLFGPYNITNRYLSLKDRNDNTLFCVPIQRYEYPETLYPSFMGYN